MTLYMRFRYTFVFILFLLVLPLDMAMAQSQPDLENGFKPYGTYAGSEIDTVNLSNGNLMLHIPMPFNYPQRGKLGYNSFLGVTTQVWTTKCYFPNAPLNRSGFRCQWVLPYQWQTTVMAAGIGLG